MLLKKINIPLIFALIISNGAFSQTNSQKNYEAYDKIIGLENTGFFNGVEFTDLFLNTDGTFRYFNGFDFTKGSVVYNGQFYGNVALKYDLLEDNLITHSEDNLAVFNVRLIPAYVESFSIYNKNFIKLADTGLGLSGNGFFEVAYKGKQLNLYIQHFKKKRDRALKSGIQYLFSETSLYILKSSETYSIISSARDVRKLFPEKETQIRDFYRTYKNLHKSNPDIFMTNLIKYLDGFSEKTNQ